MLKGEIKPEIKQEGLTFTNSVLASQIEANNFAKKTKNPENDLAQKDIKTIQIGVMGGPNSGKKTFFRFLDPLNKSQDEVTKTFTMKDGNNVNVIFWR